MFPPTACGARFLRRFGPLRNSFLPTHVVRNVFQGPVRGTRPQSPLPSPSFGVPAVAWSPVRGWR